MTQQLEYTFNDSSSTPDDFFDSWFEEERKPFLEDEDNEEE